MKFVRKLLFSAVLLAILSASLAFAASVEEDLLSEYALEDAEEPSPSSNIDLDLDLVDVRALSSLDFRDPGPPSAASLIDAGARAAAASASDHARVARSPESSAEFLARHEAESAADERLDALVNSNMEDTAWAAHHAADGSLLEAGSGSNSGAGAGAGAGTEAGSPSPARGSSGFGGRILPGGARLRNWHATPEQMAGRDMTLTEKLKAATAEVERNKDDALYQSSRKILTRISRAAASHEGLDKAVKADRIEPALRDPVSPYKDGFVAEVSPKAMAPNSKDVIDCTACRFAWMQVELDLGNSVDPVAIYDAFVTHCSEMQLSGIFRHPCNIMFANVDKMIGDYISSMSVNQLCMHNGLCR